MSDARGELSQLDFRRDFWIHQMTRRHRNAGPLSNKTFESLRSLLHKQSRLRQRARFREAAHRRRMSLPTVTRCQHPLGSQAALQAPQ